MKLAWLLIAIGLVLILEGSGRIIYGVLISNSLLIVGGIVTGWLLGGFLFYKGYRRKKLWVVE